MSCLAGHRPTYPILALALSLVLGVACGSHAAAPDDPLSVGSAGSATAASQELAPEQSTISDLVIPQALPALAAGSVVRLVVAHGAIVIRSQNEYVYPGGPSGYVWQSGAATTPLDPEIVRVSWLSDGTLVGTRKHADLIDLVTIAPTGAVTTRASGLQSIEFVVGGQTVAALLSTGLASFNFPSGGAATLVPHALATQPTPWREERARLSPDGKRLALLDGGQLTMLNLATGAKNVVATGVDPYGSPIGWTWSGDALLYGKAASDTARQTTLLRFDVATGATSILWTGAAGNVSMPSGTPRGVVFTFLPRGNQKEEQSDYWSLPSGTSTATRFLRGGLGLLVSLDGSLFSFSRNVGTAATTGSYIGGLP